MNSVNRAIFFPFHSGQHLAVHEEALSTNNSFQLHLDSDSDNPPSRVGRGGHFLKAFYSQQSKPPAPSLGGGEVKSFIPVKPSERIKPVGKEVGV